MDNEKLLDILVGIADEWLTSIDPDYYEDVKSSIGFTEEELQQAMKIPNRVADNSIAVIDYAKLAHDMTIYVEDCDECETNSHEHTYTWYGNMNMNSDITPRPYEDWSYPVLDTLSKTYDFESHLINAFMKKPSTNNYGKDGE